MSRRRSSQPTAVRYVMASLVCLVTLAAALEAQTTEPPKLPAPKKPPASQRETVTVTTTVLIPARIGAITAVTLKQAMTQAAEFAATKQRITAEIDRARRQYWECYPSCANLAKLGDDFGSWLFTKELFYLDLERFEEIESSVRGGGGTPLTTLGRVLGGEVDNGILGQCRKAFDDWTFNLRLNGGEAAVRARDRDAVWRAFEKTLPVYQAYQQCRDRHEYFFGPKSPLRSADPKTKAMALIAAASNKELAAGEISAQYEVLTKVFGDRLGWGLRCVRLENASVETVAEAFAGCFESETPREAAIALIYRPSVSATFAEDWSRASAQYDQLVASVGVTRVHDAAVAVMSAQQWRPRTPHWFIPDPAKSGCPNENPSQCFAYRVKPDDPDNVLGRRVTKLDQPGWMDNVKNVGTGEGFVRVLKTVPPTQNALLGANETTTIVVEARVEPNGRVSHARVPQGSTKVNPLLSMYAINAVSQYEFTPPLVNGSPAPVIVSVDVTFVPPKLGPSTGVAGTLPLPAGRGGVLSPPATPRQSNPAEGTSSNTTRSVQNTAPDQRLEACDQIGVIQAQMNAHRRDLSDPTVRMNQALSEYGRELARQRLPAAERQKRSMEKRSALKESFGITALENKGKELEQQLLQAQRTCTALRN